MYVSYVQMVEQTDKDDMFYLTSVRHYHHLHEPTMHT